MKEKYNNQINRITYLDAIFNIFFILNLFSMGKSRKAVISCFITK